MVSLPDEIVNHIVCLSVKMRDPHPFAEEIKTLGMIGGVIQKYKNLYGEEDAMEWLILDLDNQFPGVENNWSSGVFKKWRALTPAQRREFIDT